MDRPEAQPGLDMTRSTRKRILVVVTVLTAAAVAVIVLPVVTSRETADSWRGIIGAAPIFAVLIAMSWDSLNSRPARKTTA